MYFFLRHESQLIAFQPEADLEFATRIFRNETIFQNHHPEEIHEESVVPLLRLQNYLNKFTADTTALHLKALLCERAHQYDEASKTIAACIASLENAYEESEDKEIEVWFAIAHVTAGRIKLVRSDWKGAVEAFETGLSLLPSSTELTAEKEGGGETASRTQEQARLLRIQSLLGIGVGLFHLQRYEEAQERLEIATIEAVGNTELQGQADVLLARVLWSLGDAETAQSRLLHR